MLSIACKSSAFFTFHSAKKDEIVSSVVDFLAKVYATVLL